MGQEKRIITRKIVTIATSSSVDKKPEGKQMHFNEKNMTEMQMLHELFGDFKLSSTLIFIHLKLKLVSFLF